ncbi:MAG: Ig-like domain-containing protein, partial [Candidatus Bathyarchaeota archaeon]
KVIQISILCTFIFIFASQPVFGDDPPSSPSSITCNLSSTSLSPGNEVTVSGSILPAISDAIVTLTYTKPDSTTYARTVISKSDGSFKDVYSPDLTGSWSVKASWQGNANYLGSTSFAADFTVGSSTISLPIELIAAVIIAIVVIVVTIALYWYTKS